MRTLLTLFLFVISFTTVYANSRYSPDSDFYRNQIIEQNVITKYIYDIDTERELSRTPIMLRPTEYDFLTISTDLNNDGKQDIIAAIDHYKFKENGKYKVYIFLRTDFDYKQIRPYILTKTLDLKVLDSMTRGFKELSTSEHVFTYDGNSYK